MKKRVVNLLLVVIAVLVGGNAVVRADQPASTPATAPSAVAAPAAVAANGYPFSVTVTGKGRPMILVPGLACSGDVWKPTVDHFSANYECHVLTIHGFAGEKPFDGPFFETLRAGIAKYVADKHLSKPIVIGHSIGGFLAYVLGIEAGESVGPLVAVDGLPFLPAAMNAQITAAQASAVADQIEKGFATMTREQFVAQHAQTISAWVKDPTNREHVAKWGAESDVAFTGRAMAAMFRRDLRADVAKITSPVLLIGAGAPPTNTDAIRQTYKDQVGTIPTHTLVFAEQSHHFVMFDQLEWMWEQIEAFLKANP